MCTACIYMSLSHIWDNFLWIPEDQTLVISFVKKHLCLLRYLDSPSVFLYVRQISESKPKGVEYVVRANSSQEKEVNNPIIMSLETNMVIM